MHRARAIMNDSFEQALVDTRGKRQFVALVVNELLELSDYNAEVLSSISWQALGELPAWCVLSAEDQITVRNACGAIFIASAFRKQINGPELVKFRDSVGEPAFKYLLSESASVGHYSPDEVFFKTEDSVSGRISAAGNSVILSTLNNAVAKALYVRKYGPFLQRLGVDTAMTIFNQAQEMLKVVSLQASHQHHHQL